MEEKEKAKAEKAKAGAEAKVETKAEAKAKARAKPAPQQRQEGEMEEASEVQSLRKRKMPGEGAQARDKEVGMEVGRKIGKGDTFQEKDARGPGKSQRDDDEGVAQKHKRVGPANLLQKIKGQEKKRAEQQDETGGHKCRLAIIDKSLTKCPAQHLGSSSARRLRLA